MATYTDPQLLQCERSGRVAVISYNRPARRNAWSVACVQATIAALQRVELAALRGLEVGRDRVPELRLQRAELVASRLEAR